MNANELKPGYIVKAFHPGTLGVVKEGRVVTVGRKYARVYFGLTGEARVPFRDVVEVVSTIDPMVGRVNYDPARGA